MLFQIRGKRGILSTGTAVHGPPALELRAPTRAWPKGPRCSAPEAPSPTTAAPARETVARHADRAAPTPPGTGVPLAPHPPADRPAAPHRKHRTGLLLRDGVRPTAPVRRVRLFGVSTFQAERSSPAPSRTAPRPPQWRAHRSPGTAQPAAVADGRPASTDAPSVQTGTPYRDSPHTPDGSPDSERPYDLSIHPRPARSRTPGNTGHRTRPVAKLGSTYLMLLVLSIQTDRGPAEMPWRRVSTSPAALSAIWFWPRCTSI